MQPWKLEVPPEIPAPLSSAKRQPTGSWGRQEVRTACVRGPAASGCCPHLRLLVGHGQGHIHNRLHLTRGRGASRGAAVSKGKRATCKCQLSTATSGDRCPTCKTHHATHAHGVAECLPLRQTASLPGGSWWLGRGTPAWPPLDSSGPPQPGCTPARESPPGRRLRQAGSRREAGAVCSMRASCCRWGQVGSAWGI